MELENLCHACLSSERKIISIDKFKKQCFLNIINEIPIIQPEYVPVWLCWECDALIHRFSEFKQQVKQSYNMLLDCVRQNEHQIIDVKHCSKLRVYKIFNITLLPATDEEAVNLNAFDDDVLFEIIKNESENQEEQISFNSIKTEKDETENISLHSQQNSDDDDNKYLIELTTKRKKKKSNKVLNNKIKKNKKKIDVETNNTFKEIKLNKIEIEEERKLLALREEYVNAMFKCAQCIISFPNADDMHDHFTNKHNSTLKHKCDVCERMFSSDVSYMYHRNKHRKRYQCVLCSERYTSKWSATKHYDVIHNERTNFNIEHEYGQENGIQEETNVQNNGIVADTKESYPCNFCEKVFKWKTSLRKHMEAHRIESGQKRKPYCEPCRLSFATTSNLQKHVKTSSSHQIQLKLRKLGNLPDEDNSKEKQEARMEQIKSSVNSSREKFSCPQCDKKFLWRGNLHRHLMSHKARAKGELVCKPCNRTFSSIATYTQHMKLSKKHVTESDFKYICSDCGQRFASNTRLKEHVDWEHLKNFVHTCRDCQKVFKSHTSLYLHKQVVHKNGVEHLCDHCGKAFPNQAKLRTHMVALHTTESPYKCSWCSAKFSWHSCLSRHVRRVHRALATKRKGGGGEDAEER